MNAIYNEIGKGYDTTRRADPEILNILAIHHFQDLNAAFKEISRILVAKGKLVIFTSTPEQMENYWLNHYFPIMLQRLIKQMPSIAKIETALHRLPPVPSRLFCFAGEPGGRPRGSSER